MNFSAADELCSVSNPLDWTDEKQKIFVKACKEISSFHYENCDEIKALYNKKNFHPDSIESLSDVENIPPLHVAAMKKRLFLSQKESEKALMLTSSGTSGQKTQIWFDHDSLKRCQRMLDGLLAQEKIKSEIPTNYLIFGYHPEQAGGMGIAFASKNQLRFAPVKEVFYSVQKDSKGEWQFLKDAVLRKFSEYEKQDLPVRIMGMPAFIYDFLCGLEESGDTIKLPPGSKILTAGGWKASEDKKITRPAFRKMCSRLFGISEENIRDGYGMAEHSAPYWECSHHRLHVPVFCRLIIRDPFTLKPLPKGEVGILELISPFNTMMPNHAILSTDWAKLYDDSCPCGSNADSFEILGRAGVSKHKGCAIAAEDIIKKAN